MKFMAKTKMKTATFRDLLLAEAQGTLVKNNPVLPLIDQRTLIRPWRRRNDGGGAPMTFFLLSCSLSFFVYAYMYLTKVRLQDHFAGTNVELKEPINGMVIETDKIKDKLFGNSRRRRWRSRHGIPCSPDFNPFAVGPVNLR